MSSNYHDLNVSLYILGSDVITVSLENMTDHDLEEKYLFNLQKNQSAVILYSVLYGQVFVDLVIYFRAQREDSCEYARSLV